ncbi:MAG: hypothetical protein GW939_02085 [Candidatus Magasanikbacteria bacterium]|uniref:Peptidase C39-like domain-containing protein n=1 Tax=Candidatus Magasanikbacteria bacterium CG10_big_fil_rev_8_21_14_0_10_38_6 TaxID=1974647 RepID=A0A2M6P020_9BACT|nr:hypothetical protein [Candidatus Magasanikbacteria bacterium]NCS72358.1 hypothetical protein [Candidatus Magasanikbacteria bacterium]PIR77028.1 MAG: hypothetical protein COU30_04695 [Candidatus Magasanikbacteria bacterium CG10_big_fil_rev_8_21_14_0_10_38_6]
MKNRLFSFFNTVCLVLTGFFLVGTGYVWLGTVTVARQQQEIDDIGVVSYHDIQGMTDDVQQPTVEEISSEERVPIDSNENRVEEPERIDAPAHEPAPLLSLDKIPKKINLAVPFTSQAPEKNWDQPWQDACEEAAVLMVDAYYEGFGLSPLFAKDEIVKLLAYEEQFAWGGSIEIEKIDQMFQYWSLVPQLSSRVLENPTVEDIKQQVASGRPVLVVADGKVLPNKYFQNGGPAYHALVVRGYTEDSFITNDPGTQFGENLLYTYDDLMNSIRDWNGGDVKNGKRAVLVFE